MATDNYLIQKKLLIISRTAGPRFFFHQTLPDTIENLQRTGKEVLLYVVLTIKSGILFARFRIVKPISAKQLSLYDIIVDQKKFHSRRKVQFLWVGLLFSSHSFPKLSLFGNSLREKME